MKKETLKNRTHVHHVGKIYGKILLVVNNHKIIYQNYSKINHIYRFVVLPIFVAAALRKKKIGFYRIITIGKCPKLILTAAIIE